MADGLEWRATTSEEIRDTRKIRDIVRRARTEIRLIVDGKVVDLNRVKLPTSVIDKRFEKNPILSQFMLRRRTMPCTGTRLGRESEWDINWPCPVTANVRASEV